MTFPLISPLQLPCSIILVFSLCFMGEISSYKTCRIPWHFDFYFENLYPMKLRAKYSENDRHHDALH